MTYRENIIRKIFKGTLLCGWAVYIGWVSLSTLPKKEQVLVKKSPINVENLVATFISTEEKAPSKETPSLCIEISVGSPMKEDHSKDIFSELSFLFSQNHLRKLYRVHYLDLKDFSQIRPPFSLSEKEKIPPWKLN